MSTPITPTNPSIPGGYFDLALEYARIEALYDEEQRHTTPTSCQYALTMIGSALASTARQMDACRPYAPQSMFTRDLLANVPTIQ